MSAHKLYTFHHFITIMRYLTRDFLVLGYFSFLNVHAY